VYKSTTQKSPYCLEEAGPSKEQEAETFQGTAFVLTGILSSPPQLKVLSLLESCTVLRESSAPCRGYQPRDSDQQLLQL